MSATITLRDLRYFLAVAEEENFHRASRKLSVAQPALSRRIRDLEKNLDVTLFHRKNKRIQLSRVGEAFIDSARDIIDRTDAAIQMAQNLTDGEEGKITIGITESTIRCHTVKEAILSFSRKFPRVGLDFVPIAKAPFLEGIENGEVDLTFMPRVSNFKLNVPHFDVSSFSFMAAMPSDHRLAGQDSISVHDLHGEEILWLQTEAAPAITAAFSQRFQEAGVDVTFKPIFMSENGRLHLVAAGLGITILSETVANDIPDSVFLKPIRDLNVGITIKAVWKGEESNPTLKNFLSVIQSVSGRSSVHRVA